MKTTILFAFIFFSITFNAQTTYTYVGSGNWNTAANWSPSYPGTNIAHLDEVIIPLGSNVTVNSSTTVYGKLTVNGSVETQSIFNIVGELIANGSFNNKSFFTNFGDATFNASVTSSSIFKNEGTLVFKSSFENSSTFITDNGGFTENQSTLNNNSTLKVEFGGSIKNTGTINSIGTITNNGTFTNENHINCNTFINNNSIINDIGTINFNGSFYYLMGNNISHTGDYTVTNKIAPRTSVDQDFNIISPANPIGTYSFNDNVIFQSSSRIEVDLKTDALNDLVSVGGSATLNGILQANLIDAYDPVIGTKITILQANNGVSGTFNSMVLPDLGATKEFKVNYLANAIELEVIASGTLSTSDFDANDNKITVFPNPAKDYFYIKGLLNNEKVVITSLMGKRLLETFISPNNNKLDLFTLKSGVYILSVGDIHMKVVKK